MYIKVDRMKPLGALYPAARINPHPNLAISSRVRFPPEYGYTERRLLAISGALQTSLKRLFFNYAFSWKGVLRVVSFTLYNF